MKLIVLTALAGRTQDISELTSPQGSGTLVITSSGRTVTIRGTEAALMQVRQRAGSCGFSASAIQEA